jgi:hypothetical protein
VADVELRVEEIMHGKREMFSYWLRLFDDEWGLDAHSAWNGPD